MSIQNRQNNVEPGAQCFWMQMAVLLILTVVFVAWLSYLSHSLMVEFDARVAHQLAGFPSMGAVVTNFSAAVLAPVLLLSAYFLRSAGIDADAGWTGMFLNILGILLGSAIGWGLGVFLVPFDDADGAIYSKIGTGVTTFLSGFVVGYVPDLVKKQLGERPQRFLVLLGLSAAALMITGLVVTTNRTEYLGYARLMRANQLALEAQEKAEHESIKAKYAERSALLKQRELESYLAKVHNAHDYIRERR